MRSAAGIATVFGFIAFGTVNGISERFGAQTVSVAGSLDCQAGGAVNCVASQSTAFPVSDTPAPGPTYPYDRREPLLFGSRGAWTLAAQAAPSGEPQPSLPPLSEADRKAFADAVLKLNGDVFWAPASESDNTVTRFGDEARAVFGPIPDGDCAGPQARIIPREVDGNIVDLAPNPEKPGHPLEFVHRDEKGTVVKWTETLPKCDKPSLAGSSAFCALNSRLARVVRGNVEWLFFCRKQHDGQEVSAHPYWLRSDPRFSLLGTIGYNNKSGEIVFFDGRKDQSVFDWSKPFVPPGGRSYADAAGRATAEALYDPTFQVSCHACHDNKSPYVIDPHIAQGRIGFLSGDGRQDTFSLGDFLPQRVRLPNAPFRVVGSDYTGAYRLELMRAKTVEDPTGNCTGCHTLTTQITGRRFAADAVGYEPAITLPSWVQLLQRRQEAKIHKAVAAHRTDWALSKGGIHPWMVPEYGGKGSANSPRLSIEDWRKLSDCLWEAVGARCNYRPLYTPCPAPEAPGEQSSLTAPAIEILPSPPGASVMRILRVSWTYLNSYGGVPERDDVRVNVAVARSPMPVDARPPESSDYPSVDAAKGVDAVPISGSIGTSGSDLVMENVSYAGHTRWTDPAPSATPRSFRVELPARCGQRVLVRLLPKRFCFDPGKAAYSPVEHLLYKDVACN